MNITKSSLAIAFCFGLVIGMGWEKVTGRLTIGSSSYRCAERTVTCDGKSSSKKRISRNDYDAWHVELSRLKCMPFDGEDKESKQRQEYRKKVCPSFDLNDGEFLNMLDDKEIIK